MEFAEQELHRWLHLRAIEWTNWPAFLSQVVAPILLIFFWWPYVLAGVLVVDALWVLVRYSYISAKLANLGCLFVVWLKWPAAIGSAIYLFMQRKYIPAVLGLLWPLLAGFICIPGKIGRVELVLAKKVGYVAQNAEL